MEKEFNEEEENLNATSCGVKPRERGSENPGDWSCRDGQWVWVENVGG